MTILLIAFIALMIYSGYHAFCALFLELTKEGTYQGILVEGGLTLASIVSIYWAVFRLLT